MPLPQLYYGGLFFSFVPEKERLSLIAWILSLFESKCPFLVLIVLTEDQSVVSVFKIAIFIVLS